MNPNQPTSAVGPTPVAPIPQTSQVPQAPSIPPQTPPTSPMTPVGPDMPDVPVQPEAKKSVNKTLILVIIGSVVFLVALLVILLVVFGGNRGSQFSVNYKKTYGCSIDNFTGGDAYDFELSFYDDNTYKFATSESEYSTGTFTETSKENKADDDGAKEVDYHLKLKHEKDFMEGFDVTEQPGYESEYIVNFSEASDIVVINNVEAETVYYCKAR